MRIAPERPAVRRSFLHPPHDLLDRLIGQLLLLVRHRHIVFVPDHPHEQALVRPPRRNRRSALTPAKQGRARYQVEASAGLLSAMALHAVSLKQPEGIRWQSKSGCARRHQRKKNNKDGETTRPQNLS